MNISYNGTDILSGHPTPFFGKKVEYVQHGGRWCQREEWELSGTLIGCSISTLRSARDALLSVFSNAFGNMTIDGILEGFVEITSASIDNVDYIGSVPYRISFVHYPEESFSGGTHAGYYGVINPSDKVTYKEQADGTLEMTREISAKGILVEGGKDSPIGYAKDFIQSRANIFEPPSERLGGSAMKDLSKYFLVSSEESVNKITNTVSLTQVFRSDLLNRRNVIHRYTKTEENTLGQMETVSYNGKIEIGRPEQSGNPNLTEARDVYKSFRKGIGVQFLISEEIEEDEYAGVINYSLSHYKDVNANALPEIQDDIVITFSETESSSLLSASIQGNITANYGCIEERQDKIEDALNRVINSNFNIGLVNDYFSDFSKEGRGVFVPLNAKPLRKSSSVDEYNHTASYSASFNNRSHGGFSNSDVAELSIKKDFPIDERSIKESYKGGKYICQCLGFASREKVSAEINLRGNESEYGRQQCVGYARRAAANVLSSQDKVYTESESHKRDDYAKTESAEISLSSRVVEGYSI